MKDRPATQLYLISPPTIVVADFARALQEALAAGPVAAFQLRLKNLPDDAVTAAAEALAPIVQGAGTAFILNDRPDLAARVGADGVHIGQEDASYPEARRWVGESGIVGVTCHDSRHLAMEAAEAGADYVAFGAFFPSPTKMPKTAAAPELLSWWQEIMEVPCVAIGGMTVENARDIAESGADFVAVSAGVWGHREGPAEAVRAFNRIFRCG
ncbi:MAG: thiamine phosphate synthase [Alphaproteobacteria bacterium]|nr:thiamine phosphate synthase [Alphaproteobacteria bacterium]